MKIIGASIYNKTIVSENSVPKYSGIKLSATAIIPKQQPQLKNIMKFKDNSIFFFISSKFFLANKKAFLTPNTELIAANTIV